MNTTLTAPTYYSVVWGPDEADRTTHVDYHDGTFISNRARRDANSLFFKMSDSRTPCGLWHGSTLVAGRDMT